MTTDAQHTPTSPNPVDPLARRPLPAALTDLSARTPEGAAPAVPQAGRAPEAAGIPWPGRPSGVDASPRPGRARGLVSRVVELVRGGRHHEPTPTAEPNGDGSFTLPEGADLRELPRLAFQPEDETYATTSCGLALPPGGACYLVLLEGGQCGGRHGERCDGQCDGPRGEQPSGRRVRPVAYVDAYGRAFAAASPLTAPPAATPEARLLFGEGAARGHVQVQVGRERTAALAQVELLENGTARLTSSQLKLGDAAFEPLPVPQLAALAFAAFNHLPGRAGVSLSSAGVQTALDHLRTTDLEEALRNVLADADQADAHPLLAAPGVLAHTARELRAAGLGSLRLSDLSASQDQRPNGLPFVLGALPGMDLAEVLRSALEGALPGHVLMGGVPSQAAGAPSVRLVRTSAYANTFYVGFDRNQVSDEGALRLLEAESVLNRFALSAAALDEAQAAPSVDEDDAALLDAWIIDTAGRAAYPYLDGTAAVERAATGSDDLDCRLNFARGCESLRLPFRLEYGFRLDMDRNALAVDVEVPSSALMPRFGAGGDGRPRELPYAEREGLATRYALHLAAVVAAVALWSSDLVERTVVNCWHGLGSSAGVDRLAVVADGSLRGDALREPACVASFAFERAAFSAALAGAQARDAFEADPLAFVQRASGGTAGERFGETCRVVLGGGVHLERVRPVWDLDDPELHPQGADLKPELDPHALTERGADLLGVEGVSGLAIYENAGRKEWGREVAETLRDHGDLEALHLVRDIHDRTENLLVRDACHRVSEGISNGALTASSGPRIAELFSDIYGLQEGLARANGTLRSNPAAAVGQLEALVRGSDARGWFQDSPTRRYRYFDSYASRTIYARRCPEAADGRELRLASDEYYTANYRLASILSETLDRAEDAIGYACRLVELAPSVAASHLRLARCYFCVFDYHAEAEVLRDALAVAWSPADVGLALYWLGYALCMVEKTDEGAACYQACLRYDRSLAEAASSEATGFLHKAGKPVRALPDDEVDRLVAQAGVDLSLVEANVQLLVEAAGAAVDAGSWGLAHNLLNAAGLSLRDDALPPVLESLED